MSDEQSEVEVPEVEEEDIFESVPVPAAKPKTKKKKEKPLTEPPQEVSEVPQEETQPEEVIPAKPKKKYGKPYVKKGNGTQARRDNLAKAREAKAKKALERKMQQQQESSTVEYEVPEEEDEDDNSGWILQPLKQKPPKPQPKATEQPPWQEQFNQLVEGQKQMSQMFMSMMKAKAKPKAERKTIVQITPPQPQIIMPERKAEPNVADKLGFTFSA